MKHIAIIGGGLSGTLAAIMLLQKLHEKWSIHLIEKKAGNLGRGIAYSSDFLYQPLNVSAGKMSLFPDRPNDFYNWLLLNRRHYGNFLDSISQDSFVPRKIYGDYVLDRFDDACAASRHGSRIIHHHAEVMGIQFLEMSNSAQVFFHDGTFVYADAVIIATGNFPSSLPFPIDINERDGSKIFSNPWEIKEAARIDRFSDILLVGSGLTMLDWLIQLERQHHCGHIYTLSRKGFLPKTNFIIKSTPYEKKEKIKFKSISQIISFIREKNKENKEDGSGWRVALDTLRIHTPHIWQNLTLSEQQRFLRHAKTLWEVHRHRMPEETALLVKWLQMKKQLTVLAGRIQSVRSEGQRLKISFREKGTSQMKGLRVDAVINCIGPEINPLRSDSRLFKNLAQQGLTKAQNNGLGIQTTLEGRVVGIGRSRPLFALGSLRRGTEWEATSVPEIRKQADALTNLLIKEFSKPVSSLEESSRLLNMQLRVN